MEPFDAYIPAATRYNRDTSAGQSDTPPQAGELGPVPVRKVGNTGLYLPAISLGLWWNFGDDRPLQIQRDIIRRAFDLGIFHFDLANNYGPPFGSAEKNFGRIYDEDLRPYRDELIISTKAGWRMQPGPFGMGGGSKYLLGSLENSLRSMRLDYVDIFYSHRPHPNAPLEETCRTLDQIVRQGKARYVGISSYNARDTLRAQEIMADLGTPLAIHQPSYSLLNRWVEGADDAAPTLLQACAQAGMGVIAFSPLAQGLLTNKYLVDDPTTQLNGSRAGFSLDQDMLTEETLTHVRALNEIAEARGQSLAQMAIAWVLREQEAPVTSALIGASSVAQLEDNVAACAKLDFTDAELAAIEEHAVEAGINIWDDATRALDDSQ